MSAASIFHGLSAFPITPADAAGRINADPLSVLLSRLVDAGVDSIGLLGSTGTYMYLDRAERRRAIEIASGHLSGQVPVIVGIGALRTDDAEDVARDAMQAGASGLLLAPVSYTPLTDEEVFQHFASIARATDLPICIYNNPSTTHFTFTIDLVARLADLPTIVALKNPAPAAAAMKTELATLRARLPADFAIGYSGDWNAAGALAAGGDAWYSVIAGLLPLPALALTRAAQAGDAAEVERLDALLQPLWSLFKEFGSLRVIYAAAAVMGLCDALPPRPVLPIAAGNFDRIAAALDPLTSTDAI